MKRILLASSAIVAFAGAASAAEHTGVSFDGDAEFGYNDSTVDEGFFWSVGGTLNYNMDLNNGLSASVSGDIEFGNTTDGTSTFGGNDIEIDDLVITISADNASLAFGDTAPAADALFSSPVTNLDADGFADEGDAGDLGLDEDGVLIGRVTFGATEVGVSYYVFDANGGTEDDDFENLQIGANTTVGALDVSFGYQEGFLDIPEILAIGASTTLGGLELGFAYADTKDATSTPADEAVESIGLQLAYTVNDITVTVFYVSQDPVDDNVGIALDYASGPLTVGVLYHDGNDEDTQINVTYDVGGGLGLFAGYRDEGSADDDTYFYVGGDYDLGGGASLRVSYADAEDNVGTALDELGAAEDVKDGLTVAVSFDF
ncbi:MAG: porin [Pseudomonadota bacterium]